MTTGFWHRINSTGYQNDYDQGEPDIPVCSQCGDPLDDDEADFDICLDCIQAEEGQSLDLERLMMEVIESHTDIGDELLEL